MKNIITDIVVTGRLSFPFDMLRYDSAWPATSTDAAILEQMTRNRGGFYVAGRRKTATLNLRCYGKPTPDRWASFGWSCKHGPDKHHTTTSRE
jgi:hypothetical protein